MRVLLVEDDQDLSTVLRLALVDAGHEVSHTVSPDEALRLAERVDAVVTDVNLPGSAVAGIGLVREIKRRWPTTEVLVMTGYATVSQAVEAMRLGARTYLEKPFRTRDLLAQVEAIAHRRGLAAAAVSRGALIGVSPGLRRAFAQIDSASAGSAPVLITGEAGTGKELAARAVHSLSARRDAPFTVYDCAGQGESAEVGLFGTNEGREAKLGRLALAAGGTVLLDGIEALPVPLHPRLMRVLDAGELWPAGATSALRCTTRIIASSSADLGDLVASGRFRGDLLQRLAVLPVHLQPLRERPEDIPPIVQIVLREEAERGSANTRPLELGGEAMAVLMGHLWPGNVRELVATVRRAAAIAAATAAEEGPVQIAPEHLELGAGDDRLPFKEAQERANAEWTRRTVLAALQRTSGNVAEAARWLQMDRTALFKVLRRLGISADAVRG